MRTAGDLHQLLQSQRYPGRGILLGLCPKGRRVALYFIMGRSANSRNRVFLKDGDGFRIAPYDREKLEDARLILYRPLAHEEGQTVLTNGEQTDAIVAGLRQGLSFEQSLQPCRFEPDAPHYTPRISGIQHMATGRYTLSILKAGDQEGKACQRFFYQYEGVPGLAHFIHTYRGDCDPLPSFVGEPHAVLLPDHLEDFARQAWHSLNHNNRVALYFRAADEKGRVLESALFNRHPVKEEPCIP